MEFAREFLDAFQGSRREVCGRAAGRADGESENFQTGLHCGNEGRGQNGINQRVDAVPLCLGCGEVTGGDCPLDGHNFAWDQVGGAGHDSGGALCECGQGSGCLTR